MSALETRGRSALPRRKSGGPSGWITLDGGTHRTVTPYAPDMSWLGEPPTSRQAERYELARVIAHRGAVAAERAPLERRLDDLAGDEDRRYAREINALHAAASKRCACDICMSSEAP